jgi:excisionase family DNA binding protein
MTEPFFSPDDLLTQAQAAVAANVSIDTLRRLASKGAGPPLLRIGRSVRYRRSELTSWLDSQAA